LYEQETGRCNLRDPIYRVRN